MQTKTSSMEVLNQTVVYQSIRDFEPSAPTLNYIGNVPVMTEIPKEAITKQSKTVPIPGIVQDISWYRGYPTYLKIVISICITALVAGILLLNKL